jgi:hypothetical protein
MPAVIVDRRGPAVYRPFAPVVAGQQGRVGRAGGSLTAKGGVENGPAVSVEGAEHFGKRSAGGLGSRPAGQRLGHRVEESDTALGVRGDDAVTDAAQRRGVAALASPQPALRRMFVQRHLEDRRQLTFLERLEDIAERFGDAGTPKGGVVGVGGQVDHRNLPVRADLLGGLDAVHRAFEVDVHEHEVRLQFPGQANRIRPRLDGADHRVPVARQTVLDVLGNDPLVFDNEDVSARHGSDPGPTGEDRSPESASWDAALSRETNSPPKT